MNNWQQKYIMEDLGYKANEFWQHQGATECFQAEENDMKFTFDIKSDTGASPLKTPFSSLCKKDIVN